MLILIDTNLNAVLECPHEKSYYHDNRISWVDDDYLAEFIFTLAIR
jgi:hypothetical protein